MKRDDLAIKIELLAICKGELFQAKAAYDWVLSGKIIGQPQPEKRFLPLKGNLFEHSGLGHPNQLFSKLTKKKRKYQKKDAKYWAKKSK